MSKNTETVVRDEQKAPKKAYTRPELVKHGSVETLTQGDVICPSGPIKWPV